MGTVAALTVGLIIWIVLWSTGTKAIDAFLIPLFLVLGAVATKMIVPYVRERLLP